MKLRILPTQIQLNELPPDGRVFEYTPEGGELTPVLKDLIGENDYKVKIHLRPAGNVFQMEGRIQAATQQQCSRCGIDFPYSVNEKVNEILFIQSQPDHRGDTDSRVNHASDLTESQQEFTILSSYTFNIGEFVHEIIALAQPIQPLGKPECETYCENLEEAYEKGWLQPAETQAPGPLKENPFACLKGIKLNS